MFRTIKIASALFLLAGCATVDITQPPLPVTPTDRAGALGIDVYARDRSRGASVPRFRGQKTVEIRTFGNSEGSGFGEIAGASCTLDSGLYRAAFTTPVNIVVPNYGPASPSIFVQCTQNGKTASVTSNVVNLTMQARSASTVGTGILGAIVIGAVNESRRDNETDDFGYTPIRVNFDQ